MNERTAEFVVAGDVAGTQQLDEPYRAVIGRCGQTPIHVGDQCTAIVEYDEPKSVADYERDPTEIGREEVCLEVRNIHAYDREREVLDSGMTGSLVLTGQGLDKLHGSCTLLLSHPTTAKNANHAPTEDSKSTRHPIDT